MRNCISSVLVASVSFTAVIDCRTLLSGVVPRVMGNIQTPMMSASPNNTPTLYDTLPLTRRVNIFSSILRDHPDISTLIASQSPKSDQDGKQNPFNGANFTILAPLNSALQSLPRKPWEDDADYSTYGEQAYTGAGGEERAQRNLRKFVEDHVIPASPWPQGDEGKMKNLGETTVWWEEKGEQRKRVIMPNGVEVEEVGSKAGNGEVWVLKGVLGA